MLGIIEKHRAEFEATLAAARRDVASIRTGRANPVMVESLVVEAYGARTPLKQLAAIAVPEPSRLVVEPWDANILKDVVRAIAEARAGLNPTVVGKVISVAVPPLTAETRAALIKTVAAKIEQFKHQLRGLRDDIRDEVLAAQTAKALTEDDRYQAFAQLDEVTKEYTAKLKELADAKAAQINTR